MKEIWKDVPGYEGLYQASNFGRIRSLDRVIKHNYGGTAVKKGKILKPHISYPQKNGKPRLQVHVSVKGKAKHLVWSRCIWESFYGPIPEGMQVNHIDEDTTNNALENLNLMTPKENTNWGTGIERRAKTCSESTRGKHLYEDNPKARSIMEYDKNGTPVCFWFSIKGAAEYHKLHYTTIMLNLSGKTKCFRDGTYFKYSKKEVV